ncbi:MAG: hypothetical protein AB8C46_11820 [Burkholderiaceae bacterium]
MKPGDNTPNRHEPNDDLALDRLMQSLANDPPDAFVDAVMREVQIATSVQEKVEPLTFTQWVLLLGGGLLGVSQTGSFVLGLWAASTAW